MRFHPALALLAAVAAAAVLLAPGAGAASTSRLTILTIDEDAFRNYDFLSQTVSSTNVDWPVDLLFWNNAEIDKVKNAIGYSWTGSTMNGRLNDGAGFVWDQDGGRKTSYCPVLGDAYHYRVYADGDDRLYNLDWGYWVFGTTHIDHNECGFGQWHGRSEDAEARVAARAASVWGSAAVVADALDFANAEPYRVEGDHVWLNSGYATAVRVP